MQHTHDIESDLPVQEELPAPPAGLQIPFLTPSGPARILVKTFGCVHARNDGEYISGMLLAAGYRLTERFGDADAVVVYGCTVKNPSEDSCVNLLIAAVKNGKRAVAAGCVTQADPSLARLPAEVSIVGVRGLHRIVDVTTQALMGKVVRLVAMPPTLPSKKLRRKMPSAEQDRLIAEYEAAKRDYFAHASASFVPASDGTSGTFLMEMPPLDLPKVRRNPLIETLCVAVGCVGVCTFCKTRFARGRLQSYPPEQLIARAKQAASEGVKEIWLTGEDVGAYGVDLAPTPAPVEPVLANPPAGGSPGAAGHECACGGACACKTPAPTRWTLPKLVKEMAAAIPQDCMIRIGHTNPQHAFRNLAETVEVLRLPNVFSFLHVPVQAGADSVLRHMRRPYTIDQFRHVINTLRAEVPDVTVATDIICGYSNESEEDFQQSVRLVEDLRFPILNITQMYPRPGTPAFEMDRVPSDVVKGRTHQAALFTEFSECGRFLVGHLKNYVQVLLPCHGVTVDLNSPEFANACIKFPCADDDDDDALSIQAAADPDASADQDESRGSAEPAGMNPPTAAARDLDFEGGPSMESSGLAPPPKPKRAVPKTRQCTVQLPRARPTQEQPDMGRWLFVRIVKATRYYVFAERDHEHAVAQQ